MSPSSVLLLIADTLDANCRRGEGIRLEHGAARDLIDTLRSLGLRLSDPALQNVFSEKLVSAPIAEDTVVPFPRTRPPKR